MERFLREAIGAMGSRNGSSGGSLALGRLKACSRHTKFDPLVGIATIRSVAEEVDTARYDNWGDCDEATRQMKSIYNFASDVLAAKSVQEVETLLKRSVFDTLKSRGLRSTRYSLEIARRAVEKHLFNIVYAAAQNRGESRKRAREEK